MSKISKICNNIIFITLLVIIVVGGPIFLLQVLGYRPMAILSDSMRPTYAKGGFLFVDTHVQPKDIQVGDIITFHRSETVVITHRVVENDAENKRLTTQGDANAARDAPVSYDNVIGRSWLYIPGVGYILIELNTSRGMAYGLFLLGVLSALFVTSNLAAYMKGRKEEKRAASESGVVESDLDAVGVDAVGVDASVTEKSGVDASDVATAAFAGAAGGNTGPAGEMSMLAGQASHLAAQASLLMAQMAEVSKQATALGDRLSVAEVPEDAPETRADAAGELSDFSKTGTT